MDIKISSYRQFLSLSRKKVMKWDKKSSKFILRENAPVKELIKGLRYIRSDFNQDLRKPIKSPTKKKVEKVLNEYFTLKNRENVKIVTPRRKYKKAIAELSQQPSKNWKKFYIPSDSKSSKIVVKKKKGGGYYAEEKTKVATYINVYFDLHKLAVDSDKEVDRVTKPHKNKQYMRLHAGEHLVGGKYGDVETVKQDVTDFMEKYGNPLANNFYENWMTGIKIVKKFNGKNKRKKSKK